MSQSTTADPELARMHSGNLSPSTIKISSVHSVQPPPSSQTSKDLIISIVVILAGWYIPKYMSPTLEAITKRQIPFQVTKAGDVLLDLELNQPVIEPMTIPSSVLIATGIFMPIALLVLFSLKRQTRDMPYALTGLFWTIGISEGATQVMKIYVLRRRPNFYKFCEFSVETLKCTAPYRQQLEAQLSFPSGHSSLSFSSMTYLAWYLLGQDCLLATVLGGSNSNSSMSQLTSSSRRTIRIVCSIMIPWAWAAFVATSRLVDMWHHPSDVVAGTMIGMLSATIAYHCIYPPITSPASGKPIALLTNLHESSPSSIHE